MDKTARRVLVRYLQATEFPSQEALEKYLKDHPKADPKNHSVKNKEPAGDSGGEKSESSGVTFDARAVKKVQKSLAPVEKTLSDMLDMDKSGWDATDGIAADDLDVKSKDGNFTNRPVLTEATRDFKRVTQAVADTKAKILESVPTNARKDVEKALNEHFKDCDVEKAKDKWDLSSKGWLSAGSEKPLPKGKHYDLFAFADFVEDVAKKVKSAPDLLKSLKGK